MRNVEKEVCERENLRTGRIPYLDVLRMLAMVAVMVIHQAATGYTQSAVGSYGWTVCLIYDAAARFAVPVFVMISGALYLDPRREITLRIMSRKATKMMLIFAVWSLAYALAESVKEYRLFSAAYGRSVLEKTLRGHYHMWYIYLTAALYLAAPLLRAVAADRTYLWAVTVLAFLLGMLPVARNYVTYAGYFCLGYGLRECRLSKKQAARFLLFGIAVLMAALLLGITGDKPQLLLRESMPHVWLCSAAVFLYVKTHTEKRSRFAEMVVPCGLGIYLLHPAVNFLLRKLGVHALTFDPLLCVPLCTLAVFAVSFWIVRLLRKIPAVKFFT